MDISACSLKYCNWIVLKLPYMLIWLIFCLGLKKLSLLAGWKNGSLTVTIIGLISVLLLGRYPGNTYLKNSNQYGCQKFKIADQIWKNEQ